MKLLQKAEIPVVYAKTLGDYKDGMMKIDEHQLPCDLIINSSFRKAIVPTSNIEIALDQHGFIATNETFQTNNPNIYAVGDVNGKSYLAHMALLKGSLWLTTSKGLKLISTLKTSL
jgi:dihydrolipoamide dehydrogenase